MAVTTFTNKIKLTMFLFLAAVATARTIVGNPSVFDICAVTDFKETCHKSLSGATGTQPKDLLKAALDTATVELESVVKKTAAYKTASSDDMTKGALIDCEKVLNDAIYDLRRSSEKVEKIDIGRLSFNIADVRNWLGATLSYKEDCIDALKSNSGEEVEEMKAMLQTSSELLSNGLAMITNMEPHLLGHDEETPNLDVGIVAADAPPKTVTVAKGRRGDFRTINSALTNLTQTIKNNEPVVILVKPGTYKEYVTIGLNNVTLIGEGPMKTIISGNRSNATGWSIMNSSTLAVEGEGFVAKDIKIENTAPSTQAVAVRVRGDRAVFHNVHIESLQDTLYAQQYKQFYRDCRISGTVDFIFGDATAVFQNCDIVVRRPPLSGNTCAITAQGRMSSDGPSGTVIQGCRISNETDLIDGSPQVTTYLGRPWRPYSRTIIMQSVIGGFVSPAGWVAWEGNESTDGTVYYAEWCNNGTGANTSNRVKWTGFHNLTKQADAQNFTAQRMFVNDDWVKKTGVPYVAGLLPIQPQCSM